MDERRHNMDGALFVDEERGARSDERREGGARARHAYDDGKADAARRVTQGILDRMDLEATVHVREDDERVVLDLEGPDAGRAIGKKGMTLEALQFLVNKIVNRDPDERRHIVLDSGDYRERHDNGLVSMAKREAKRAVTSGRAVTLEPMSARDRRVIHVSLAKFPGVSTRSEGEGMDRRLQIIPARGERGGRDARDERPREARSDRAREPRDERPRDERVRDVRDERPRDPRDERPRDPRDERPRDPRDERPREPRDERPREPRDERPREPRDERPREPRDERPREPQSGRAPQRRESDPRRERDASRGPAPVRTHGDDRDARSTTRDYGDRGPAPARGYADDRAPARDLDRAPARDLDRAPARDLDRAPARDLDRAPARDLDRAPARDLDRAPVRDGEREYTRDPDARFDERDRLDRGRGR